MRVCNTNTDNKFQYLGTEQPQNYLKQQQKIKTKNKVKTKKDERAILTEKTESKLICMCTYTYTNKQTHKQIGIKVNIIQTSKVRSSLVRRD